MPAKCKGWSFTIKDFRFNVCTQMVTQRIVIEHLADMSLDVRLLHCGMHVVSNFVKKQQYDLEYECL
jgi:hypothetical protein